MEPSSLVMPMSWTKASFADILRQAMDARRQEMARRLAALRDARGWTQDVLAQAAGVKPETISRLEHGKHDARPSTLSKIAKALEVDVSELLGPPPPELSQRLDEIQAGNEALVAEMRAQFQAERHAKEMQAHAFNEMKATIEALRQEIAKLKPPEPGNDEPSPESP